MSAKPWTRREVLKAVPAALVLGSHARLAAAQSVKWSVGSEAPKLKAPANATDCHHHIYDAKYPVDPGATLRPGDALVERLSRAAEAHRHHAQRAHAALDLWHGQPLPSRCAGGIRSDARAWSRSSTTRYRPRSSSACTGSGCAASASTWPQAGATTPEMIEPLSKRVNDLGWHIQINASAPRSWRSCRSSSAFRRRSCSITSRISPQPDGVNHPLFARVRALMDKGRTWVKLSGAYADTKVGPPSYADSSAVARAYAKAVPERLRMGQRLAASDGAAEAAAGRRGALRPAGRLGARREDAPSHPRGQPDDALRFS